MYITIGEIITTFGCKGALKIYITTDFPEERFKIGAKIDILSRDGIIQQKVIENAGQHKKTIILKFVGCDSASDAKLLVNSKIVISEDKISKLPENNYYFFQIIGLKVYNIDNDYLGEITDCFSTGSNDVYVVTNGKAEILIPALKQVVKQIDLQQKKMIVELLKEYN